MVPLSEEGWSSIRKHEGLSINYDREQDYDVEIAVFCADCLNSSFDPIENALKTDTEKKSGTLMARPKVSLCLAVFVDDPHPVYVEFRANCVEGGAELDAYPAEEPDRCSLRGKSGRHFSGPNIRGVIEAPLIMKTFEANSRYRFSGKVVVSRMENFDGNGGRKIMLDRTFEITLSPI